MENNNYCDIQNQCKLLIQATNQYNQVVLQNQNLQKERTDLIKKILLLEKGRKFSYKNGLALNKELDEIIEQNKTLEEELEYLASFFDKSEVDIVNRLICYNRAVNAIRDIAASARADAGITDDYFKRNNYSQKQEQLKTLIQNFDKILKFCEVEKCN